MSPSARREYVREIRDRYRRVEKRREKIRIVTQVSETLRCHRKHAGTILRGRYWNEDGTRRRREKDYPERLIDILAEIWAASLYPWSVRLKALLPLWMPWIRKRQALTPKEEILLLAMSPSTIDRRLKERKERLGRRLYGKTKPGRFIKQSIPIHTEWRGITEPGWVEVDTVSHSGPSALGPFVSSVNEAELLSGWVESRAILGKSAAEVEKAMENMRLAVPFKTKGIDSDNGEEFINYTIQSWCLKHGIQRWRSRPYKKDDQAHIEQKNGTHVRRLIGWHRYDTKEAVEAMNSLYSQERCRLMNLFLPSVRLDKKIRHGSRIKRIYDCAKTPLDRLLESGKGDRDKLEAYRKLRERLDPFELSRELDKKLEALWRLAAETRIRPAPTDYVPPRPKPKWPEMPLEYNPPPPLFRPGFGGDIKRIRKMWWRDGFFGTR